MKKNEKPWHVSLTPQQALDLLEIHLEGRKKRVHTFEGMGLLMGCDMDLTNIKKTFKKAQPDEICLSGPNMRGMNHGVAVWRENRGWLFISSDEKKVKKFEKDLVVI